MYQRDTSSSVSASRTGAQNQRESRADEQAVRRAGTRRARSAPRVSPARLRAAQAAVRSVRPGPAHLLRLALPPPEGPRHRGPARGGRDSQRHRRGQARSHRLQAHGRRQGEVAGAAGRPRPGGLGGRQLRGSPGAVLPDRRRRPVEDPRGPAQPAGGTAREGDECAQPHPGSSRPLHPRAAAARTGVGRARGALAQRADRDRARRRRRGAAQIRDNKFTRAMNIHTTTAPPLKENPGMGSVRVAIVGVGNCAASLVQGVEYYKDADPSALVPGLMHVQLGDYHVSDIEFVAAFDVDGKKVGRDLAEAIVASENNTIKIADVPPTGIIVQRGHTLDGLGKYYLETIEESDETPVDVVQTLKDSRADVLVCYLPVGSEEAAKFYAQCAIDAGVGFVNCLPVFIAGTKEWADKFTAAGVPIVGDDIKSQVGATITHRVLAKLFEDRGVILDRTYQLNVGGNMDFMNMLERDRLESKKISKTQAVTSNLTDGPLAGKVEDRNVHIGPSDYVAWLDDRKWAYVRLEGTAFGDVPLNMEYKLEVWDSPNSAGVVIDALRCCKIAKDRGLGGPILPASAYFMKSPPVQVEDGLARTQLEGFIAAG